MTIREILSEGKSLLDSPCPGASIDNPARDATLLLTEALQIRREDIWIRGNETISEPHRKKYFELLERRRNGECIAYILGHKEFRGLDFIVNPSVLVPRPDTEILVEAALEYIDMWQSLYASYDSKTKNEPKELTLLDLCTGSGIVAISLKNERPFLSVTASDISSQALKTATLNAGQLFRDRQNFYTGHLDIPVHFVLSDLFENIRNKFSIIVSNPPYIPSGEISALAPEVQREPRIAIDGGNDGLDFTTTIISKAPEYLLPNGVLLLEAGAGQMPAIQAFLKAYGFGNIMVHRDLAGRDRVISAQI